MDFKVHRIIAIVFVLFGAAGLVAGQTSSELRARYGEPQMTELKNNRPAVERFLVRPEAALVACGSGFSLTPFLRTA